MVSSWEVQQLREQHGTLLRELEEERDSARAHSLVLPRLQGRVNQLVEAQRRSAEAATTLQQRFEDVSVDQDQAQRAVDDLEVQLGTTNLELGQQRLQRTAAEMRLADSVVREEPLRQQVDISGATVRLRDDQIVTVRGNLEAAISELERARRHVTDAEDGARAVERRNRGTSRTASGVPQPHRHATVTSRHTNRASQLVGATGQSIGRSARAARDTSGGVVRRAQHSAMPARGVTPSLGRPRASSSGGTSGSPART